MSPGFSPDSAFRDRNLPVSWTSSVRLPGICGADKARDYREDYRNGFAFSSLMLTFGVSATLSFFTVIS